MQPHPRSRRIMLALAVVALGLPLFSVGSTPAAASTTCAPGWTANASLGTCVRSFTSNTTWTPPVGVKRIDYVVVGGGGGGAQGCGSNCRGGAGGAVVTATGRAVTGTAITITVGNGGGAAASGSASSLSGSGLTVTAAGGAVGGGPAGSGANGPSSSLSGAATVYGSSGGMGGNYAGGSGAGRGANGSLGACGGGGAGVANRGGGGGGGTQCNTGFGFAGTVAGPGGSGVIIISYAITVPSVSSFTTASASPTKGPVNYTLTIDPAVDAATLTAADLTNAGTATGCAFATSPSTGSSTVFTVAVSNCGNGTLTPRLRVDAVTSVPGDTGPTVAVDGATVTLDVDPPAVPASPSLDVASDSGTVGDGITSVRTPRFVVTGSSGDTITVTATGPAGATATCAYVVGAATGCSLPTLAEGTWSVRATATDPVGNLSAAGPVTNLVVDATAPGAPAAVGVAGSVSGAIGTTTPTVSLAGATSGDGIEIVATGAGGVTARCAFTAGTATSCVLPPLTDGSWSVAARATDPAGNASVWGQAATITIDTVPPAPPGTPDLASVSDTGMSSSDDVTAATSPRFDVGGLEAQATVTITATGAGGATVSCSSTAGTTAPATAGCSLDGLGEGAWTVGATSTDRVGNTSSSGASMALVIDRTAPVTASAPTLPTVAETGDPGDGVTSAASPSLTAGGAATGQTVTIIASGPDAVIATCTFIAGSTTDACTPGPMVEGTWSVRATITDVAGNVSSASPPFVLTIDRTAPSAPDAPALDPGSDTGTSADDGVTAAGSLDATAPGGSVGETLQLTATGPGGRLTSCSARVTAPLQPLCPVPITAEGRWTVVARLVDAAGNVSPSGPSITVDVDWTAPTEPGAPTLAPESAAGTEGTSALTATANPTLTVAGIAVEEAGGQLQLDATDADGNLAACSTRIDATTTASCTLAELADGQWRVQASVTDAAGNRSNTGPQLDLVVDTTAPAAPDSPEVAGAPGPSSNGDPEVTIAGVEHTDTALVVARSAEGTSRQCTPDATGTCRPGPLADGTWTVTVVAIDTAGNRSPASPSVTLEVDTAAPAAPSRPDLASWSDTGTDDDDGVTADATPSVRAQGGGTGVTLIRIEARATGGAAVNCTFEPATIDLCDLPRLDDGPWTLTARAVDAAGNTSAAGDSLAIVVDTTASGAPTIDGVAGAPGPSTDTLPEVRVGSTAAGDQVIVSARRDDGIILTCVVPGGTSAACRPGPLLDGDWTLSAVAVDAAGNRSATSSELSLTIDTVAPGAPGAARLAASSDTGLVGDNVTAATALRFEATAADPAVRTLRIEAVAAGVPGVTTSCTLGQTEDGCTITGLVDGVWTIRPVALDSAGNATPGPEWDLTIDRTAPQSTMAPNVEGAPGPLADPWPMATLNLTAAEPGGVMVVTADGPDDAVVTCTAPATTTSSSTTSSTTSSSTTSTTTSCRLGPLDDGEWTITAVVTDVAGNHSSPSPETRITVDTSAPAPPGRPVLAAASDTGRSDHDNLTSATTPSVSVAVADPSDVVDVRIAARQGLEEHVCVWSGTSGGCELPRLDEGVWTVTAVATDPAGNRSTSAALTIEIDTSAPAEPEVPDLHAASDTGARDDDNRTRERSPEVQVPAVETADTIRFDAVESAAATDRCVTPAADPTSCRFVDLGSGVWSITAVAIDVAGNESTASAPLQVVIDVTSPNAPGVVTLDAASDSGVPGDGVTSRTTVEFDVADVPGDAAATTVIASGPGGGTRSCRIASPASRCSLDLGLQGSWSVYAVSEDAEGNRSDPGPVALITIDATAPTTPSVSVVADRLPLRNHRFELVVSDLESATTATVGVRPTVGHGPELRCEIVAPADSCSLEVPADGTYSLTVWATDLAGNQSARAAERAIEVDTRPEVTMPDPAPSITVPSTTVPVPPTTEPEPATTAPPTTSAPTTTAPASPPESPESPETTVPPTTVPQTTVPPTTVPPTTVPPTTVPATTVPQTTVPQTTVPATTIPQTTVPATTVPQTTVPQTTVPPTSAPTPSSPAVPTSPPVIPAPTLPPGIPPTPPVIPAPTLPPGIPPTPPVTTSTTLPVAGIVPAPTLPPAPISPPDRLPADSTTSTTSTTSVLPPAVVRSEAVTPSTSVPPPHVLGLVTESPMQAGADARGTATRNPWAPDRFTDVTSRPAVGLRVAVPVLSGTLFPRQVVIDLPRLALLGFLLVFVLWRGRRRWGRHEPEGSPAQIGNGHAPYRGAR